MNSSSSTVDEILAGDSHHVVSAISSIVICVIQFILITWILCQLKRRSRIRRKAPLPPIAGEAIRDLTFGNNDQGLVDAEFTQYFLPRAFSKQLLEEAKSATSSPATTVTMANIGAGTATGASTSADDESIKVQDMDDDNDNDCSVTRVCCCRSDVLVLPIYYRFLVLQALHCAVWMVLSIWLVGFDSNIMEWGESTRDPKTVHFIIISSCIIGIHAAIVDGVGLFLAKKSVGRAAIRRVYWFALLWGLFNAGICALATSLGNEVKEGASDSFKEPLPQWDPFFCRTCTFTTFNLLCVLLPNKVVCNKRAPRSGKNTRHHWFWLASYNCLVGIPLIICYLIDFHQGGYWSVVVPIGFFFFYLLHTPILFYIIQKDSEHWRLYWHRTLTEFHDEQKNNPSLQGRNSRTTSGHRAAQMMLAEQHQQQLRSPLLAMGGTHGMDASGRPSIDGGMGMGGMGGMGGISSQSMVSEGRDIMIDYHDLEYQKVLGRGGFSTVYSGLAWCRVPVAIKVMHVPEISREVVEDFLNEAKFIMSFRHQNLVRFVGACISPPDFAIAMELCSKRSLADLLKLKVHISQYRAIQIAMAVANALKYMHSKGVIHRDLKAGNILFGTHGEAKVCDFGLSVDRQESGIIVGTASYMAPEVIRREAATTASDIYSFGIILWELLSGTRAWRRPDGTFPKPRTLMTMVAMHGSRPERPPGRFHVMMDQLMTECWLDNASERPNANDVLERLMAYAHLIITPTVSVSHGAPLARPLDSFGPTKPALELPRVLPRQQSRLVL